ncbi:MAG: DUF4065 domain-containing protein [Xanthobacteraceae bacterium]
MSAPTSAAAVANAFLDIQDRDQSSFPRIDQMKLQKLLFYAHAWWLAQTGQPLFDDDVEAWPWGPVVRNVYGDFAEFGRAPIIGKRAIEMVKSGSDALSFRIKNPPAPPPHVQSFLESVWQGHKHLTGIQLSNATHAPGEPWTIMRDQYGSLTSKPNIPNDLIRDVFRGKLK